MTKMPFNKIMAEHRKAIDSLTLQMEAMNKAAETFTLLMRSCQKVARQRYFGKRKKRY